MKMSEDDAEALHPSREFVRTKLESILNIDENCSKQQAKELAEEIEEGIHDCTCDCAEEKAIELEWSPLFRSIYLNSAVRVYSNLNPESSVNNSRFRERVVQGEFDPLAIANLTPQEMFPKKWKKLLDEKFKIDKNLYETRTEAATDIYKCGKCQKRVCTYFQLQTRSADEPMTTFVTCINCGNRWKH